MRLTEAVTEAVANPSEPAAVLALTYAASIDEATHVALGLADALATLYIAADIADGEREDGSTRDSFASAHRKVAAALSAVTVVSDLGPKLLAALDALTLTPKARAAIGAKMDGAGATPAPVDPLQALRESYDGRQLRVVN